jgi:hypothetical protein
MKGDYIINILKEKPYSALSSGDETLDTKITADTTNTSLYTQKQDGKHKFLSVQDFYDSCALVLEGNNALLVSLYDGNTSRLDGVVDRFVQAESRPKGYVFGGDPGNVFDVLGVFREHDVALRGGYFDFYTGPNVDVDKSLSEERFSDMLKQFLDVSQGLNLITNDIYTNTTVADPSLARKSIAVYASPRLINVYVTGDQYEPFLEQL